MSERVCGELCNNWKYAGVSGGFGAFPEGGKTERSDIKTGTCLKTGEPHSNGDACDCDGWEPKK
jgi:hypothetical protein